MHSDRRVSGFKAPSNTTPKIVGLMSRQLKSSLGTDLLMLSKYKV